MGGTETSPPGPRVPLRTGLLLAALSMSAGLLLVEGGLRLAGFRYDLAPTLEVGWPDPKTIQTTYADDPDLFWVTRDYSDKLRAARRTHPAVVFMGDSCTEFGTYPARTIEFLAAQYAPVATTGVHLAVGGWSSEQGRAQLQRDVLPLHPRVVVIYYGWNDHWMALGPTDRALHLAHRFLWLAEHLRIAQVVLKATIGVEERGVRPNRVPAARYRQNLEQMATMAHQAGIIAIFVTAPANHVAGHEPAYLLHRHVQRLADVIPLHGQYTQLTRDAATATGAPLCDAASEFSALPGSHDRYFKADGIHFTPEGDQELAEIVGGCITHALRQGPAVR